MVGEAQMERGAKLIGVYPPTFCNWRLLLAVMVITEVSVILVGLGPGGFPGWKWLAMASIYAQWLALFCAAGLCIISGWTGRFSSDGAWMFSWLMVLFLTMVFSFAAWLGAGISMPGAIQDDVGMFVFKNVFAVGLVAFVFFRYLVMRARWKSELMAQSEARVQALQARIQPHFLFNSLNTIASLVHDDPENAEEATLDLADIFRGSLRQPDQTIPLEEELKLARQYLDMEKRRLGDRLELDWRVDELPPGAAVLPLMLQPLLENAVAHGIQAHPEGGRLSVYGRPEGDQVVITIGNPVPPEGGSPSGHGIAIENIRERLVYAFGSRARLMTNQDGKQFYAVMVVPYVEHTDH
jgi:two-component system sensor histidine kinase AlgZ